MSSLARRKSTISSSKNPITSNTNLTKLLSESKDLDSQEAFSGWKESFLDEYKQFLDPAGVDNAEAANDRLVRSLEKLSKTVVTVNEFVKDGKITAETQSVQGKRHLTNMTDQMAETEKEVARFLPSTGAEEAKMGYDKFELGAVMIEDGFHVYEHLKTTKDIIQHLQDLVLNEVLPKNKQSIIQFYLRQIQTFCDVMADLGLFELMERMMELYNIKPRTKSKPIKEAAPIEVVEEEEKPRRPERVLDPHVNYKHRAAYTGGYFDPFSGAQPGREEFEDVPDSDEEDDQEGEGDDDDNHFIIYFDMKTGTIGKIPRDVCRSSNFIVAQDDKGNEEMQGQIEDQEEKEQLIWDMKKAMKGGAPSTPKQGPRRNTSSKSKSGSPPAPPFKTAKDPPERALSAKANMESSGEEKPLVEIPPKGGSNSSGRGDASELVVGEIDSKRPPLRKNKSESLAGMGRSPGALSRRPKISRASSGDGLPTLKSPGALSNPKISRHSVPGDESSSFTKSQGSLSKRRVARDSGSGDEDLSTKSPGTLSKRGVTSVSSADKLPTMSPGALSKRRVSKDSVLENGSSTKSPGALNKRRVSRAASGDGLPLMSPGTLSKRSISRSKSARVERTPLEGNNKLASIAPSSNGWSTPSKLATKRRAND